MADNLNTQTVDENLEGQQQVTGIENQSQESQERLYAGRFKTPEELENAYKNSSTEGQRLATRARQLEFELQQARTPREAEKIQDKIDDLNKYFDPETAKVLGGWHRNETTRMIQEALNNWQQNNQAQSTFVSQVTEVWEETKKLYPDVADPKSKLYQRANEILLERNLAQASQDGSIQLLTPFAYRIAVEAAVAEQGRQAPDNANLQTRKNQAGLIAGRGSRTTTFGKLNEDQYMALSDEQRDAYDRASSPK